MNNQDYNPFDDVELSPQDTIDVYKKKSEENSSDKNPFDDLDFDEGFWKKAFRTAAQIPQGIAEATMYGIGSNLFQMLALGESDLGIEEWHKLRELAEKEGIPFDEEAYEEARKEMLGMIPTVSNISSKIEKETGLPLEPREGYQKALRLGSMAGKFQPGTVVQKAAAGITAPVTSEVLQEIGVPESLAEIVGLGAASIAGAKSSKLDIGKKTKPSGLVERQFENVKSPREVSESKLGKINEKLKSDFKKISDKIIIESPIGETATALNNDPTFKQQSREILNEAQQIADTISEKVTAKNLKKELADISSKKVKGYAENEYDKSYSTYMKKAIDDIKKDIGAGQLVEQYRKNNDSLSEYFEPGASKALNRAKRDALLDQNRAIANIMKKSFPETELPKVFKEGNERWSKIMDAEAVDEFVSEIFKEKVNYKKMQDFFDKQGHSFIFKRALGPEGYKNFELLMKDMLSSETPYKMLKIAKEKGFDDLFKTGLSYIVHPQLGAVKAAYDVGKSAYKRAINSILDQPKLSITWRKSINNLKKGDFKSAEKRFITLDKTVKSN